MLLYTCVHDFSKNTTQNLKYFQSTVLTQNLICHRDSLLIRAHTHDLGENTTQYIRGGIKIFKALDRLASNSKFLLSKSEKNSPKSCLY
jgi:hypothetical protein